MSIRQFAGISVAAGALGLSLALAAPALAADDQGAMPEIPAALPAAPALPPAPGTMPLPANPDLRPQWQADAVPAAQLDPRVREAWLGECRHRTRFYYESGWYEGGHHSHHRKHKRDHDHSQPMGYQGGYDYCEAYLDDYYRYYSQAGVAYGQAYMVPVYARPMQMTMMPTQTREVSQPVEEVVTEEYVPVRTRKIQRRPIRRHTRDKRIRVY